MKKTLQLLVCPCLGGALLLGALGAADSGGFGNNRDSRAIDSSNTTPVPCDPVVIGHDILYLQYDGSLSTNQDPCCDNPDPCCASQDPCCGNPDPCCNDPDPCCGNPDPCCDDPDPCCDNPNDPCCDDPDPCCGIVCDDNNNCTDDECVDGACIYTYNCPQDDDPCTNDYCVDGECENETINCDDGNECTEDSCNGEGGCDHVWPCDEPTDPCKELACVDGECQEVPRNCDDGNECTDDSCDPAQGGCVHKWPCEADPDPCIERVCIDGKCEYQPKDCDDDDPCTTGDYCEPGTGRCVNEPMDCDDENGCTKDTCMDGQCAYQWLCTDDDPCTINTCVDKSCRTEPKDCDDHDLCTTGDYCDPATGNCINEPIDCDDDNPCTTDTCEEGYCYYEWRDCDDGDPCTYGDYCDTETGDCVNEPIVCDDEDPCTDEYCEDGWCVYECDEECVDLDVDSNNDGSIGADDDEIEEETPGKFILVNDDDDDGDNTLDWQQAPVPGEDDLVPIQLSTAFQPDNPDEATWTLYWWPYGAIRVWENDDKSGDEIINGAANLWSQYGGLPGELYVEALGTGPIYLYFWVDTWGQPPICLSLDWVMLSGVKFSFNYDESCSRLLKDWPAQGNYLRSAMHHLSKDEQICAHVFTTAGLGNTYFAFQITSDSDGNGINLKLDEVAPGDYANTAASGEVLRLNETSREGPEDWIKVVDEELLTFSLEDWPDGNSFNMVRDVMIDRAEGTGGGIDMFYGTGTGDRAKLQQHLWGTAQWWKNADVNIPNTGSPGVLRTVIKNAGDNHANRLEADLAWFSTHGCEEGNLYDDGGAVIFDPNAGAGTGFGAGDWNNDIDWAVLAACLELNNGQVCTGGSCGVPIVITGRMAWQTSAFRGPRPLHGILGAFCPLDGNLQAQMDDFFDRAFQQTYAFVGAYAWAMEYGGANPQPHAELWINQSNYAADGQHRIHADVDPTAIPGFGYITLASLGNVSCGRAAAAEEWAGGKLKIQADLQQIEALPAELRPTVTLAPAHIVLQPDFQAEARRKPNGSVEYSGDRTYLEAQGRELTEVEAAALATAWLTERMPERMGSLELVGAAPVRYEESDFAAGTTTERVVGYLVEYIHKVDGVKVLYDTVRVRIVGDKVDSVLVKLTDAREEQAWPAKAPYLEVQDAYDGVAAQVQAQIAPNAPALTLQRVEAAYWTGLEFTAPAPAGEPRAARLVYRYRVTDKDCDGGQCLGRKWAVTVDAATGDLLKVAIE